MRLQHLKAFLTLAEELNFRNAAARLCVSQPTLTAHIQELETALGVLVFERGRRGTRLTPEGERLLPFAATAAAALGDLLSAAAAGDSRRLRERRRFRVGLVVGGIGPLTWPTLEAFQWSRPDLELVVRQLGFRNGLAALAGDTVDALLLHGPADDRQAEVTTIGHVRVGVLLGTSHPLAQNGALDAVDVVPLLRYLPPPEMGPQFRRFWVPESPRRLRPPTRALADTGGITDMTRASALGGAVGLWPVHLSVATSSGAVVRPLEQERWAPLQVAVRVRSPEADALVEAAKKVVAQRAHTDPLITESDHRTRVRFGRSGLP